MYASPRGVLLLAEIEGEPCGCAAVWLLEDHICELKRVYVRTAYRGSGLGRLLTETALEAARDMGYSRIRLDTLPQMAAAQRLYESVGFRDIDPYYGVPVPGQRFMEAMLN
jgi:ribosomal protein S18 acetylase RimI-like enzyme